MPTHVLIHADVRTQDPSAPRAEALAWRDDVLLAVGSEEAVVLAAGADATIFDAGGATVLPGFVDPHHHPAIVALYGGSLRLAKPDVHDIESLKRALAAKAQTLAPGEWLIATDWDELALTERRPPTRAELDDAVPDHPLFAMHYTCHRAAANSRALELAGIDRNSPDPAGGTIERGRDRLPSGVLIERAMCPVERLARASMVARDAEGFLARLAAHHRAIVREGITLVVDATVPGDLATLYREAARRELLLVPTVLMPVSLRGYLEAPLDVIEAEPTEESHPLLRHGPVKLVFDGAPQCAMCLGWLQTAGVMLGALALSVRHGSLDALRGAMSVAPRIGLEIRTGIKIYDQAEARDVIAKATAHGHAVATHAIGNEAIDVALDAYASVGSALTKGGRPRLEHATFLDRARVRRIADLGIAVVTQPFFVTLPMFASAPSIPGLCPSPNRWLKDAGVLVAGSSDFPVAGFAPLDGIRAAVHRKSARGEVHEADQRLTLDEAIELYTRSAAEVSGALSQCGTLEPNKRADIVVLDRALDEASLAEARVSATVVGGRVVHGALGSG